MNKKKLLIVGVLGALFIAGNGYRMWREANYRAIMVDAGRIDGTIPVSLRLAAKGHAEKPLLEWTQTEHFFHSHVPKALAIEDLAVQVKTPEGWTECRFNSHDQATTTVLSLGFGVATIWIDNVGGPAKELSCGEAKFSVPANKTATMRFVTPLKQALPLLLGDEKVGEIAGCKHQDQEFLHDASYLLDCQGGHRYSYEEIYYASEKGFDAGSRTAPIKTQFSGAQLYLLPLIDVDYFLTRAPATFTVKTSGPIIVKERKEVVQILRE